MPQQNAAFEPSGEFEGFPLYRAVDGGPGIYYRWSTCKWYICSSYTSEIAKQGIANTRAAVGGGRVPLGEQTWSCVVDSKWQDQSVTITALTAAEMDSAKEKVKETTAVHKQAAIKQAKGALKHGFQVTCTHVTRLNTAFELSGEFEGFPLYRAINNGEPGLYYRATLDQWYLASTYTRERAQNWAYTARLVSGGGHVPLGEQVSECWVNGRTRQCSLTITALTAVEMAETKEKVEVAVQQAAKAVQKAAKKAAEQAAAVAAAEAQAQKEAARKQGHDVSAIVN